MKEHTIWVVNANSSFVEIFSIIPGREVHRVHHEEFLDAKKKGGTVNSDRAGRSFDSMGASRHAYSEVDLRAHEQQVFAHMIADILRKEFNNHAIEKLALIAAPEILGQIRLALPPHIQKVVYKEINKDVPAYLSESDRIERICQLLEIKKPEAPRLFTT